MTPEERLAKLKQLKDLKALKAQQGPADFSAMEMVKNIPGSAVQLGRDIIQPVLHPQDTAKSLWGLAQGLAYKLTDGVQPEEAMVDAVATHLKKRYGGWEEIKATVQKDPIGVLSDVAGVFSGGGALGLKTAGKVGALVDPLNLSKRAAGAVMSAPLVKNLPKSMYESAAKFSTAKGTKKRDEWVQTALDEDLMPTGGGVRKMADLRIDLNNQIDTLINAAAASGGTVPIQRLMREMPALVDKMGPPRQTGAKDVLAIGKVINDYYKQQIMAGKVHLTVKELQDFKTDIYKKIDWDRSQQKAKPPVEEARKAMGRQARGAIEEFVPEIADVNRRYGRLEELQPHLERSANRIGNTDFLGIGTPIKTGAGAAVGGAPGALMGAAVGILDMPKVKSRLALTLNALSRNKGKMPKGTEARVLIQSLLQELGEEAQVAEQAR